MDESTLKEIRNKINGEIEKTEKTIIMYKEMAQPIGPENAIGRISRMDAINNKSVTDAALSQAEEKLHKLNYMKTQVGKEGFGSCRKCRKAIPIPRLLLMPQSNLCVNCAV
jgi:DnaK suppressor protein